MNTFVPHGAHFAANALCLDKKRRFKQLVECDQMLAGQFPHHPAVQMWAGRRGALVAYRNAFARFYGRAELPLPEDQRLPVWLDDLSALHRDKLVWKMPEHYAAIFPDARPENLPRYPVVSVEGDLLDWVQREGKTWRLDSVPDKVFRTGWAAIQYSRGECS